MLVNRFLIFKMTVKRFAHTVNEMFKTMVWSNLPKYASPQLVHKQVPNLSLCFPDDCDNKNWGKVVKKILC